MKALIEDLLDLETLGAKSFPLDVQPVESRDLLEDAVTDAQSLANAKHISLVLDLSNPPKIHADPHRLSQVLSNLLGNAIKFTPEGGTVTLCARTRDGALSVTIADTGRGLPGRCSAHIRSLLATQGIGRRGNGARAPHRAGNRGSAWRTRVGRVFSPRSDLRLHVAARTPRRLSRSRSPSDTVAITPVASKEPRPRATMGPIAARDIYVILPVSDGRTLSRTLRGLTQFPRNRIRHVRKPLNTNSIAERCDLKEGFALHCSRTVPLILNGEMSEWSIEHAWKRTPATLTK